MGEPRCAQTDLLVSQCAPRLAPEPMPVRASTASPGPVFAARFDSVCPECGDPILEGDEARMVDGTATCLPCCGDADELDSAHPSWWG